MWMNNSSNIQEYVSQKLQKEGGGGRKLGKKVWISFEVIILLF